MSWKNSGLVRTFLPDTQRIGRRAFIFAVLVSVLLSQMLVAVLIPFFLLIYTLLARIGLDVSNSGGGFEVFTYGYIVANTILYFLISNSAKRRIQDFGLNGNIAYLIYSVTPILFFYYIATDNGDLLLKISRYATLLITVILMCARGTHGANSYGYPPD